MIYTVRKAAIDDINIVKKNSTEEGKVDKSVIERSEEMRCFLCDDEPLMVLGLVDYPTGSDEKIGIST